MSGKTTRVMLAAYEQAAEVTLFLAGMFRSPRENFHNSAEVEIDIEREDEDISIAVQDLSAGARNNESTLYTNKTFTPPVHKEKGPINALTLITRNAGEDPFESVDFIANAIARGIKISKKIFNKILRSIEVQASQVLTTGTVTLTDENGAAVYVIDYKPKVTHFPNAALAWDNASATIIADLLSLCQVIKSDGKRTPDMLIMGEGSYELFIKDDDVIARLDNRRIEGNGIVPMERMGDGGIFRGVVEIGNYKLDIWTYAGEYKDPQSGNLVKYIPDDKVVVRASAGRLDATFGGIPRITNKLDPRVPAALVGRTSIPGRGFDVQNNAWITEDGETLFVSAGTRPLLIPTAIDTFGCLDTLI